MGRNQKLNTQQREAQLARILACSLRLFVHQGFAATRIADIAFDAGISQGLLYHYFAGKDEILLALLNASLPRMDEAARDLEALQLPASEKLRIALDALLSGLSENSDTSKYYLLIALASASDALPASCRALIEQHASAPYATMRRIFAKGQKEGSVRAADPREQALLFWALVKGLSIHHAVHGSRLGSPSTETILPLFLKEPPCQV